MPRGAATRIDSQTSLPRAAIAAAGLSCTLLVLLLVQPLHGALRQARAERGDRALAAGRARIPLYFEPNAGQTDPRVRFLSHGAGYTLFLTPTGAVIRLTQDLSRIKSQPDWRRLDRVHGMTRRPRAAPARRSATFRISFDGARSDAKVEGIDPLVGHVNYFAGNDPKRWRTFLPTYARVRYRGVWPGVDLVYYGTDQALEYDFIVAPRADPNEIRLNVEGADAGIDLSGDVLLKTAAGELRLHRPRLYQDGPGGVRRTVEGRFVMRPSPNHGAQKRETLAIEVFGYDRSRPLVIDPQLVYSTYLGGSGGTSNATVGDIAFDIALDSSGHVYVTGLAYSIDFPTTTGASQSANPAAATGTSVGFVAKLNPSASGAASLVYATYLGGGGNPSSMGAEGEQATGVAVDGSGDAFVTGLTFSDDFPTTPGAFQTKNPHGAPDVSAAFVTELDPSGSKLVYSTFLGGRSDDAATRMGLVPGCASNCEAYVAGVTTSSDFPIKRPFQATFPERGGTSAAFVTIVAGDGGSLEYSTFLGGTNGANGGGDGAEAIAVDSSRNAYVTGFASSSDFPSRGAFQKLNKAFVAGEETAFVAKLNPSLGGTASLVYSSYLGGSGAPANPGDFGTDIAVDSAGRAFVTGPASSPDFPTVRRAFQRSNRAAARGGSNAFVTEVSADGSAMLYSTLLGGSGGPAGIGDTAVGVAIDSQGHTYVTGASFSTDFPTTSGACQTKNRTKVFGGENAFITELNPAARSPGEQLVFSTYFGGSAADAANGIAIDRSGHIFVGGASGSPDLPTTLASAFQTVEKAFNNPTQSQANAFLAEIDPKAACGRMLVIPSTVNFASAGVGAPAVSRKITIKNSGRGLLEGSVGPLQPPFTVPRASLGLFSLAPGAALTIEIDFQPLSTLTFNDTLALTSDDPSHQSVPVHVIGTGAPGALAVSNAIVFGRVGANGSKLATLTIRNTGLGVLNVTVDDTALGPQFTLVPPGSQSFTLNHGDTRKVTVKFAPTSKGPAASSLKLTTDDPANPSFTVTVKGSGS